MTDDEQQAPPATPPAMPPGPPAAGSLAAGDPAMPPAEAAPLPAAPDAAPAAGPSRLRVAWGRVRDQARERWHRHGKPLVRATRDLVSDAADMPREELERERYVKVGEAHLKRLLGDWVARSPRLVAGEVDLAEGLVHLRVTLRRWRPVVAEARFRLRVGSQDDTRIEVGIVRTQPTLLAADHVLMRLAVWCRVAWARWRGEPDPFDHALLRIRGARHEGDTIFVPVPRQLVTDRVGKSRVLRRIAAYATISSLRIKPGELVVGFHLGRLVDRISDMYVLRHLLRDDGSRARGDEDDETLS